MEAIYEEPFKSCTFFASLPSLEPGRYSEKLSSKGSTRFASESPEEGIGCFMWQEESPHHHQLMSFHYKFHE